MQKRKFRSRPARSGGSRIRYTFHSYGTSYSFDPFKIIEDDRLLNEAGYFERVRQLDLYKDEVRMANLSHVYIRDETGEVLKV